MAKPSLDHAAAAGAEISRDIQAWGRLKTDDVKLHPQRYAEWTRALKRTDLLPIERLLPIITISDCGVLPPAMRRAHQQEVLPETLAKIRKYAWGYYFSLGSGQSTLGPEKNEGLNRTARQLMLYRMNAIDGAIAALFGGDLSGKRVIDLACNHGAFSLDLLTRGASYARGVDIRAENIEKARLLARQVGVDNVDFEQGDIYDEPESQSEIVLCFGLLYHVTKPFELIELCYRLCIEMAVIDTVTHREPFSGFILGSGQGIGAEHAAGAIRTELHPTYRGLIDLMRAVGFREIIEVEGVPDPEWVDWEKTHYANKTRRCLIGLK
jgi:2-polyprenyl-3-methyl-5-hydroxy-6-metoxy-1,4-benzoquinol methylase